MKYKTNIDSIHTEFNLNLALHPIHPNSC